MCRIASRLVMSWVVILVGAAAAHAWTEEGTAVSVRHTRQVHSVVAADGLGGAIVAWEDSSDFSGPEPASDIHAQRLDVLGAAQWGPDGVPVVTAAGGQDHLRILADGQGGAYLAWRDFRDLDGDIYVQRVDGDGLALWQEDGLPVCAEAAHQGNVEMVRGEHGGIILTWRDERNAGAGVFAQALAEDGSPRWTADGVAVCTATGNKEQIQPCSDGGGGAIVAWLDQRTGESDIYVQRVDIWGSVRMDAGGVPVCTAPGEQAGVAILSDGARGAFVAWMDARSGGWDVYLQRIDLEGVAQWATDGVPICTREGDQGEPLLLPDGEGGVLVLWSDGRTGPVVDLYAQRVDGDGGTLWATGGVPVCEGTFRQDFGHLPKVVVADGSGGLVAAWEDARAGGIGVYAQRLDALGATAWQAGGVDLSTAFAVQTFPRIATDGAGGAVVSWVDTRVSNGDIFAQQVDAEGRVGFVDPVIHSVRDVPGDQGGTVNLAWDAPRTDAVSGDITEYSLWRALDAATAAAFLATGATVVDVPVAAKATRADDPWIIRQEGAEEAVLYWELVGNQVAYRLPNYAMAVPTLLDSTAVDPGTHHFQVIAHTADPAVFYVSAPDSGHSVDNLAPAAPQGLSAAYTAAGVMLDWDDAVETDFQRYRVYRSTDPFFTPGPGDLVHESVESGWIDTVAEPWGRHYRVSTLDHTGNESVAVAPSDVSAAGGDGPPAATALEGAVPNPFNPSTTVRFTLASAVRVRLSVYDLAGRRVATLLDESRPAGRHAATWEGRDDAGRPLASGVYLCRLEAGGAVATRRMVLVK